MLKEAAERAGARTMARTILRAARVRMPVLRTQDVMSATKADRPKTRDACDSAVLTAQFFSVILPASVFSRIAIHATTCR
jgi:hypothetical protein